jgi:uncharacterized Fe-S cluster-containing radical SAM superfamily protein
MYDPVELTKKTEKIVLDNEKKKYFRFRPTSFYGGIATADTVGCNLRCCFCWSGNSIWNSKNTGIFYSPEEVADILNDISRKKGYNKVRISGGEPTIGKKHLISLLENIEKKNLFILETNGILLGNDQEYVEYLSKFSNLHIRICLKGCNNEEFSWLTGASNGFEMQLKSLEFLREEKIRFNIALISIKSNKGELINRLKEMNFHNIMIEQEDIVLYPGVKKRLGKKGVLDYFI